MSKTINYIEKIKELENENTISLVGNISIESLEIMDVDELLYIFPLIERIVIEIYKLVPGTIVEVNEQGTMNTIIQIIEKNSIKVLPQDIEELIYYYYRDKDENEKALRNLLFHVVEDVIPIKYNKDDIKYIVMKLLEILNAQIKKFDIKNLKLIEKI